MRKLIQLLFKGTTKNTLVQLFRYGFVGGGAFLVDYGSLWLLTEKVGLPYLLSAALAFTLGLITNYLLSTLWVFDNHKLQSRWKEILVFTIIGVIGLGLNELIMYLFTEGLAGLHYMVSKIISTVLVFFWNFFARKFILFDVRK